MKLNNNDDSHNSGLNLLIYNMLLDIESHPAWVCGLKPEAALYDHVKFHVTPCVGVWIETSNLFSLSVVRKRSHPAWVCGLKHRCHAFVIRHSVSHPAWVCGLKHS